MDSGLNSLRGKISSVASVKKLEERRLLQLREEAQTLEQRSVEHQQAIKLCDLCLAGQVEVTEHIEDMNNALLSVFEEPISLKFATQYKADKVTISGVKPVVMRGERVDRPSGGQKTVVSLGLVLAFLKLKGISQVLLLDEYMSDLSSAVTPKVVDLLTRIGTQIIWVTHSPLGDIEGSSSKVFQVVKRNGASSVQ